MLIWQAKKERTKEEKAAEKAKKDAFEAPYLYATIDGRKEKVRHVSTHLRHVFTHLHHVLVCATVLSTCQVGNFRVEPPGLFRGRGEHPKMGMLKARAMPERSSISSRLKFSLP